MINFKQTTAVNRQILRDSTHTNSVNFMILSGKKNCDYLHFKPITHQTKHLTFEHGCKI